MKRGTLLLFLLLLCSCTSSKKDRDFFSDVSALNKDEKLMNVLKSSNDDISIGWTFKYDLLGKNQNSINVQIHNKQEFDSIESKEKLTKESLFIQKILKENFKSYISLHQMKLYLISNKTTIDSLKIDINN